MNKLIYLDNAATTKTAPEVGRIRPQTALSNIVLPEPFLPCSPYILPLFKVRLILESTLFFFMSLQ